MITIMGFSILVNKKQQLPHSNGSQAKQDQRVVIHKEIRPLINILMEILGTLHLV